MKKSLVKTFLILIGFILLIGCSTETKEADDSCMKSKEYISSYKFLTSKDDEDWINANYEEKKKGYYAAKIVQPCLLGKPIKYSADDIIVKADQIEDLLTHNSAHERVDPPEKSDWLTIIGAANEELSKQQWPEPEPQ